MNCCLLLLHPPATFNTLTQSWLCRAHKLSGSAGSVSNPIRARCVCDDTYPLPRWSTRARWQRRCRRGRRRRSRWRWRWREGSSSSRSPGRPSSKNSSKNSSRNSSKLSKLPKSPKFVTHSSGNSTIFCHISQCLNCWFHTKVTITAFSRLFLKTTPTFGFTLSPSQNHLIVKSIFSPPGRVTPVFHFWKSIFNKSEDRWQITLASLTPYLEMGQSETRKINHRGGGSIMEGWRHRGELSLR